MKHMGFIHVKFPSFKLVWNPEVSGLAGKIHFKLEESYENL